MNQSEVARLKQQIAHEYEGAQRGLLSFEQYLQQHHLEPITVSVIAQVRYLTVWNAMKGKPITPAHAAQIRAGVLKLTGVPYTGSFALTQEQPVDQLPGLPIKTLKRHSHP